jgi:hypothetical protein
MPKFHGDRFRFLSKTMVIASVILKPDKLVLLDEEIYGDGVWMALCSMTDIPSFIKMCPGV